MSDRGGQLHSRGGGWYRGTGGQEASRRLGAHGSGFGRDGPGVISQAASGGQGETTAVETGDDGGGTEEQDDGGGAEGATRPPGRGRGAAYGWE